MHVDAIYARRTQAGAPVVHGIYLLLWALESLAASLPDLQPVVSLKVDFKRFVYLNSDVEVVVSIRTADAIHFSLLADGIAVVRVKIGFCKAQDPDLTTFSAVDMPEISLSTAPRTYAFSDLADTGGRIPFPMGDTDATTMFPAACRWIGSRHVASLGATSYIVGMVCPGLHSIYNGLNLNVCPDLGPSDSLAFRVSQVDELFNRVVLEIGGGGWSGTISAFLRTPPQEQPNMGALTGLVRPGEFAQSTALIIGGSRGLGELTAKLIACGGGRIIATWKSGEADAERVAEEIRAAGGECSTLQYDALEPAGLQLLTVAKLVTHAYYFATPAIFRQTSELFSAGRFGEFQATYIEGFWQLVSVLRTANPTISLFYPSSVSVTERPRGMTEYSMSKAAGEVLCADINNLLRPTHVTVKRLPRLSTDQTASLLKVETEDAVQCLLPIIREVQSWPD